MVPNQLQTLVSDAVGVPFATVHVYARALREAGYLSKGGRGRSSVQMTPADAATLLLALMGASAPSGAADALVIMHGMRLSAHSQSTRVLACLAGGDLDAVGALATLIEAIISGRLQADYMAAGGNSEALKRELAVTYRLSGGAKALKFNYTPAAGTLGAENCLMTVPDGAEDQGLEIICKMTGAMLWSVAAGFIVDRLPNP